MLAGLLLLAPGPAWAACEEYPARSGHWYPGTHAVQSLARDDVQSCLDDASFDAGDTVHLPAGSVDWGLSGITYNKRSHVIGAGKTATIIRYSGTGNIVNIGPHDGSSLQGLKFFTNAGHYANRHHVFIRGADNFVIGDVHFYKAAYAQEYGVLATGANGKYEPTGVIHNCTFENGPRIMVYGSVSFRIDSRTTPAVQWADRSITLGGPRAVYVEDSACNKNGFGNCVDSEYGGSFVYRYNTVTGGSIDNHGSSGALDHLPTRQNHTRGNRYWEIYRNTVSDGTSGNDVPVFIRGGTGVLFDNTIAADFTHNHIKFDTRRVTDGQCDGNHSADGNQDRYGYPCRDQIGMGYDSSLWTIQNPSPPQVAQPAYVWGNTLAVRVVPATAKTVVKNRDFYEADTTNCPAAGPDCTQGVGAGTLSQRPQRCTRGVGWWATDQGTWNKKPGGRQGVLYTCEAANTWTLYYTPYEYPHPLRTSTPRR